MGVWEFQMMMYRHTKQIFYLITCPVCVKSAEFCRVCGGMKKVTWERAIPYLHGDGA